MTIMMAILTSLLALGALGTPEVRAASAGDYCAVDLRTPGSMVCAQTPSGLTDATTAWRRAPGNARASVLIARLYDDPNFDPSAGYLEVNAGGDCTSSTTTVDYQLTDLGAWSNRTSSFKSYGTCRARIWTGTAFSGSAYPGASSFTASAPTVSAGVDNMAKSAQFS